MACHYWVFFLKDTDWEGAGLDFGGWLQEKEREREREPSCPGNHRRLLRVGAMCELDLEQGVRCLCR